ncbi:MAG: hypothetical protein M3280_02165 [Actinomycetota bacterium]|nr:hypothetical protein [Actinomycetota bacterium]
MSSNRFDRPVSEQDWKQSLGRKVSIRFRLHDEREHPFSEAIGMVQSVRGEGESVEIEIVNRTGKVTSVPLADIEAAKLFPTA